MAISLRAQRLHREPRTRSVPLRAVSPIPRVRARAAPRMAPPPARVSWPCMKMVRMCGSRAGQLHAAQALAARASAAAEDLRAAAAVDRAAIAELKVWAQRARKALVYDASDVVW